MSSAPLPVADCPILVWMLSLNREYTKEVSHSLTDFFWRIDNLDRMKEYDACHKVVSTCVEHVKVPYNPRDSDSFRESFNIMECVITLNRQSIGQLITLMLPLLMMRHRRIPRSKWKDCSTASGKRWIEQVCPPCAWRS